jgi:hypothetical protein
LRNLCPPLSGHPDLARLLQSFSRPDEVFCVPAK